MSEVVTNDSVEGAHQVRPTSDCQTIYCLCCHVLSVSRAHRAPHSHPLGMNHLVWRERQLASQQGKWPRSWCVNECIGNESLYLPCARGVGDQRTTHTTRLTQLPDQYVDMIQTHTRPPDNELSSLCRSNGKLDESDGRWYVRKLSQVGWTTLTKPPHQLKKGIFCLDGYWHRPFLRFPGFLHFPCISQAFFRPMSSIRA